MARRPVVLLNPLESIHLGRLPFHKQPAFSDLPLFSITCNMPNLHLLCFDTHTPYPGCTPSPHPAKLFSNSLKELPCPKPPNPPYPANQQFPRAPSPTPWATLKLPPTATTALRLLARSFISTSAKTLCLP